MRVLVLTDKYFPIPHANAICVQKIIDELIEKGCDVDVIAHKDSGIEGPKRYHSSDVYYVQPDIRNRLFYYSSNFPNRKRSSAYKNVAIGMNRIKKLLMFPFFPVYSFNFPMRLFRKIEKLNRENKYDLIISIYAPFDNLMAGYWFKKRHSNIAWIVYALDTIVDNRYPFLEKAFRNTKWYTSFLKYADLWIYMRSRKGDYLQKKFDKYSFKLKESDIPLLDENENSDEIIEQNIGSSDIEHWVYAGGIVEPYYKVDDLIDIFLSLPNTKKRILHFYSHDKEMEKIKKWECVTNGRIMAGGYIAHEELMKKYAEAYVLVSVKYCDLISAKVFEYMSYKKYILHVSGCKEDPNAEYIDKYKRGLVLKVYDESRQESLIKLQSWLNKIDTDKGNTDFDLSPFEKNRASYSAHLITECLGGRSNFASE